ncbi:TPRXL isoform X1 [Spatholobus suberectus]|nr:TPRXL isoform X1 [Spatholobus suberectus]
MGSCCGESADNKQVIAVDKDHIWSSKKVEADEGLNTVGCLRGRLLAERQASRVAKKEAESMGNKLVELEKLLREEIKLRDKAERRLKFLKKRVESFNIPSKSGQLEHSDSSEKCENSCGSSSISSLSKHSEANEIKHDAKNSALPEIVDHNDNVSEASTLIQTHNSPSSTKDCDSQNTDNFSSNSDPGYSSPQILSENLNPSSRNLKNDENRLSSLSSRSSVTETDSDHTDFCDNSLALVPVTVTGTSQATSNPKPINVSVLEALDALRHARERLQSSMRTRQMIQVGPI